MSSYSKTILMGHLGKDPDIHTFENGDKIAKFSLATSESYRDKSGQKVESTEWHLVVVKGKGAGIVEQYVHKGDLVMVDGKNKTRDYEKNSVKHYTTEVICFSIVLMPKGTTEPAIEQVKQNLVKGPQDMEDVPFDDLPI